MASLLRSAAEKAKLLEPTLHFSRGSGRGNAIAGRRREAIVGLERYHAVHGGYAIDAVVAVDRGTSVEVEQRRIDVDVLQVVDVGSEIGVGFDEKDDVVGGVPAASNL